MTHEGVKAVFKVLYASYPNFNPRDIKSSIEVWERLLNGFNDEMVANALHAYILSDTKGFPPAIGQIVDIIKTQPDEMSELEAWTLVERAVRNGNYGAEKEFSALPVEIQQAVGSPGQIREWAKMNVDSLSVAQSNFLRSYRIVKEREKKASKMPPELKQLYHREIEHTIEQKSDETEERAQGVVMPDAVKEKLSRLFEDKT